MKDRTQTTTAAHSAPAPGFAKLMVSEYVDKLRASYDAPLNSAREGATVTATVSVYSIGRAGSGRLTGVVTNDGGSAIVAVPQDRVSTAGPVLAAGATVTVRGTVEVVAGIPTIRVLSVKAVS